MKRNVSLVVLVLVLFSCAKRKNVIPKDFNDVEIETILQDSLLNVRAIELGDETGNLFFATSNGDLGFTNEKAIYYPIPVSDSLELNFRAVAHGFVITIGSPTFIFKIQKDSIKIVYQENHPKTFYDSMDFWNNHEGIAIGDSTDGCLSIIVTRDGGDTWTKLPCNQLPKGLDNEGAFAASDTNIAIIGESTWVATTAGRVYYSPDKAKTWQVFDTPIVKEKETEGIYSIDFYDELNGFAIGGDYTNPDANAANKIKTTDGGKTWHLVAQNQNPGYRSCVQYVPNGNAKELVAVGFKGIDFSNDSGGSWKHLSDEGFYTIRFLNDSVAYVAGAGRISKLTFKE
ncbi:oxidoreductase [Flavobacteriaceae bacterium GSB9]|nr:oxidoreductase [Flavobacteriaceae bacterium GSB9]